MYRRTPFGGVSGAIKRAPNGVRRYGTRCAERVRLYRRTPFGGVADAIKRTPNGGRRYGTRYAERGFGGTGHVGVRRYGTRYAERGSAVRKNADTTRLTYPPSTLSTSAKPAVIWALLMSVMAFFSIKNSKASMYAGMIR